MKRKASKTKPSLMACVKAGDVEAVRNSIASGVGLLDEMEDTSLLAVAVEKGDAEMVKALLDLGHKPDIGGIVVPLAEAALGGNMEIIEHLLAEGVRVDVADESGDTALHRAAQNGDVDMIGLLLAAGAPLEAEGCADFTPLLAAADRGQTHAVRALLQAGADLHAKKGTILCYACEKENCLDLVLLLLNAGAKVNVTGGHRRATPLHVATEHDQVAVVRRLLDAGAKVHTRDPDGWTPFLNAALRSGVETVQLLIKAGSDIIAVDHEGRNAYDLASKWGKREVAEFLKPLLGTA